MSDKLKCPLCGSSEGMTVDSFMAKDFAWRHCEFCNATWSKRYLTGFWNGYEMAKTGREPKDWRKTTTEQEVREATESEILCYSSSIRLGVPFSEKVLEVFGGDPRFNISIYQDDEVNVVEIRVTSKLEFGPDGNQS